MPQDDFFWFLVKSIDILKQESSAHYLQLSRELKGLRAKISTGMKKQFVYFDNGQFFVTSDAAKPDIEVVIADHTVLNLIDGKFSLEQAILTEAIFLKGSIATLEKYRCALAAFLDGALRAPSFIPLLSHYRRTVSERAKI